MESSNAIETASVTSTDIESIATTTTDNFKLKQFLDKLEWENNIPKNVSYLFTGDCEICKNLAIAKITAPYFVGNVTTKELHILFDNINFPVTDDLINSHREHISATFNRDDKVEKTARKDMSLIESDLPKQIDEKIVIDSTLRGLYARRLYLEQKGKYDEREYKEIVAQLHNFTSLKLKMKGAIKDDDAPLSIKDLIDPKILEKIGKNENENSGNH